MRNDNYTSGLRNFYAYKSSYSGWSNATARMVFENGFITNDGDLTWAQQNTERVAQMIVDSCLEFLGIEVAKPVPPTQAEINTAYKRIKTAVGKSYSWEVKLWQERLNAFGADLVEDGLVGPNTEAAHRAWTKKFATIVQDRPGRSQWRKLLRDTADLQEVAAAPPVQEPAPEPMPEPVVTPIEEAPQGVWPRLEAALARIEELEHVSAQQDEMLVNVSTQLADAKVCLLYTSPSPRDS